MSLSADAVVLILQSRLDYLSARTVLKQAALEAGLTPSGPFQGADIEKLAASLLASAPRMASVVEALRKAGGTPAKAPSPVASAPVVSAPVAQAPVAQAPVAEPPAAVVEAPAEATEAEAKPEVEDEPAEGDASDGKARPNKGKPGKKG